jgi:hypothetical protein
MDEGTARVKGEQQFWILNWKIDALLRHKVETGY